MVKQLSFEKEAFLEKLLFRELEVIHFHDFEENPAARQHKFHLALGARDHPNPLIIHGTSGTV